MGWTSTGDPYANLGDHTLSFDSKEAAVDFVQKHGWNFSVIQNYSFCNLFSSLFFSFISAMKLT